MEDKKQDIKTIAELLENSSFDFSHASSIAEAVACSKKINPDIILLDIKLTGNPSLLSLDTLILDLGKKPIIILSESDTEEQYLLAAKKGAFNFLNKTDLNTQLLSREIEFAMERWRYEEQLVKAMEEADKCRKAAEQQSIFKSRFLAQFSHEIRTPLNAVIGVASLLEHTQLDDHQTDLLESLNHGSDRLLNIVNDVLDISKIESNKLDLKIQTCNVRNLVNECLNLFGPECDSHKIFLTDFVAPDVPSEVKTDPNRIKQILLNYLSNAIKHTHMGSIEVRVEKKNEHDLLFTVRDSGKGIPEEVLPQLFTPFTQAHTDDDIKGTGLGLVVCKKLAQLLSGTVGVNSQQGKGSNFWFTIKPEASLCLNTERDNFEDFEISLVSSDPFVKAAVGFLLKSRNIPTNTYNYEEFQNSSNSHQLVIFDGRDELYSNEAKEKLSNLSGLHIIFTNFNGSSGDWNQAVTIKAPYSHSKIIKTIAKIKNGTSSQERIESNISQLSDRLPKHNILVVDDDPINRKIIQAMLNKLGLKSQQAKNGKDAVEKHTENQYDLIFMDCSMPVMDGYEASKIIRKIPSNTIIIALTAHALRENYDKCIRSGMDYFLVKPIRQEDINELLETIHKKAS